MGKPSPGDSPPSHPTRYALPRKHNGLMLASMGVALALVLIGLALAWMGRTSMASPGELTLAHAGLEFRCEQCHQSSFPHRVADLRCQRCHDPRANGRLGTAAHATWIAPSSRSASRDPQLLCSDCHTDHAGAAPSLTRLDPHVCSRCHFSTLDQHPRRAAAPATAAATSGLHFSHAVHDPEERRVLGRGCDGCHELTDDLSTFEPISFDKHCASCHLVKGSLPGMTDPVSEASLAGPIPENFRAAGRGRVVISRLQHRDPWILDNVRRLGRGLESAEQAHVRADLTASIASLERARAGLLADQSTPALEESAGSKSDGYLSDRSGLELELRGAGPSVPISLRSRLTDDRALLAALSAARSRLASLDQERGTATTPADRAARIEAAQALMVPCLACHQLPAPGALPTVALDLRRFSRGRFTHSAHVVQAACETCHEMDNASTSGTEAAGTTDLTQCWQCHAPGRAASSCLVCHWYHPAPAAAYTQPHAAAGG